MVEIRPGLNSIRGWSTERGLSFEKDSVLGLPGIHIGERAILGFSRGGHRGGYPMSASLYKSQVSVDRGEGGCVNGPWEYGVLFPHGLF